MSRRQMWAESKGPASAFEFSREGDFRWAAPDCRPRLFRGGRHGESSLERLAEGFDNGLFGTFIVNRKDYPIEDPGKFAR